MPQRATKPPPTASDPLWRRVGRLGPPCGPAKFTYESLTFQRVRIAPLLYRATHLPPAIDLRVYRSRGPGGYCWATSLASPLCATGTLGKASPAVPLRKLFRELRREIDTATRALRHAEEFLTLVEDR